MSRRRKLLISIIAPFVVAVFVLTLFRAPGSTVEGFGGAFGVSGKAPSESYSEVLNDYPVEIAGHDFTANELGVGLKNSPKIPRAWSFGEWGKDHKAAVTVDEEKSKSSLERVDAYGPPQDASVNFEEGKWTVEPSHAGQGLDIDLADEVKNSITKGDRKLELELTELQPAIKTSEAQSVADTLNDATLKLNGGDTTLETLKGNDLAEFITVESSGEDLTLKVDKSKVSEFVEDSSQSFTQSKVDGKRIVDDEGKALKTVEKSVDGFTPAASNKIADAFEKQIASLLDEPNGILDLPGDVSKAKPVNLERSVVVDASDHMAYFYENGDEVKRFPVAVGKPGTETDRGTFKVYAQLETQHMGSCDAQGNLIPGGGFDYCTPDVPWISYFNGDEGFHGTYWHDNFGNDSSDMSHGCVNLRVSDAKWSYEFLQVGSKVTVRD